MTVGAVDPAHPWKGGDGRIVGGEGGRQADDPLAVRAGTGNPLKRSQT